jgi:hypothetical protein
MKYIKKCAGYILTGLMQEQVFFFRYGKSGSNVHASPENTSRPVPKA